MMKNIILVLLALIILVTGLTACNNTAKELLPRSMKGYELYSWPVGEQWHFTLITGTNRTKTYEEVTSSEDLLAGDGWVRIHVQGVEAVKALLSRIPEGEWVFWAGSDWATMTLGTIGGITLPPQATIDAVKAHADGLGLQFHVSQ